LKPTQFVKINKIAGYLLLPYLALSFIMVLNEVFGG
jgi:tryptophan-rich sensory protein